MSLINQMLRDLENRQKSAVKQLPSVEEPAVAETRIKSRRPLLVFCCGLLLIGLIWLGLDMLGRQLATPRATVKRIVVEKPAARIAISPKPVAAIAAVEAETKASVVQAQPAAKEEILAAKPVANQQKAPAATKTESSQPAPDITNLLDLKLLEVAASTRLMLEFERLPSYSWKFLEKEHKQLLIVLKQASHQPALVVPKVNGPLLTQLSLQPGKRDIRLLVTSVKPLQLDVLNLPADRFHGPRLLFELSRKVESVAVTKEKKSTVAVLPTEKQPAPQPAPPVKRVSKTLAKLSPQEQANQAYREAMQQLQRNETLAAETSFTHALTLQPKMLDARLQLVALLLDAGRKADVEKQLLAGLKMHPENPELRKNYARRLLEAGHLDAAADLLQSAPRPTVSGDLEYHALLAALQQELGQHQAAAENYRQLLAYRPQAALWWLGLAISLDQSGNAVDAKEAYQRAESLPGLREDLQDYVNNRLQTL